jgi:hypothetical protein
VGKQAGWDRVWENRAEWVRKVGLPMEEGEGLGGMVRGREIEAKARELIHA